MKWTASGLLLAVMFVLVFAGTLSASFGIEENLQQNGIIESNVADAVTPNASTHTSTVYWTDARDSASFDITRQAQYWNVTTTPTNTTASTGTNIIGFSTTGMSKSSLQVGRAYHTIELGNFSATSIKISCKVYVLLKYGGGTTAVTKGASLRYSTNGTDYDWISTAAHGFDRGPGNAGSDGYGHYMFRKVAGSGEYSKESESVMEKTINGSFTPGSKIYLEYVDSWYANSREIKSGSYGQLTYLQVTFGGVTTTINLESGANGAISPSGTQTFNSSTASVTSTATPNEGYHFDGWYVGSTKAFSNNPQTFTGTNITAKETYTANFALNKLNVVYWRNLNDSDNTQLTDPNGNTFTYTQAKAFYNLSKTDGKTFVGWATARNGTVLHGYGTSTDGGTQSIGGVSFLPSANNDATVNLYAIWIDSDFGIVSGGSRENNWGSQSNPFVISTVQHLKNLSEIVNGFRDPVDSVTGTYYGNSITTTATKTNGVVTFANCYFVISADIGSASAPMELTPIGRNATNYFAGTISGQNNSQKTIYLNIQQSGESNVGLFGYVKGASISYIKTAGTVVGGTATGGLVGYMENGEIFNCSNSANVSGTGKTAGIVAYNFADVRGRIYGTITNSGNITGSGFVGGIAGQYHGYWCDSSANYGTFTNSGTINGGSGASVGGVTGFTDSEIRNAANTGSVTGGSSVGGIAGRTQNKISNSYNTGNIRGTSAVSNSEIAAGSKTGVFAGGITGYTTANATISHCYNKGDISALSASGEYISSGDFLGGIVGYAQATVEYCANIGGLIDGNNYIGGIVGDASSTTSISYCYDVEGQRNYRWDYCNLGAITGSGGTVTNSWAIKEKDVTWNASISGATVSTSGRKLVTSFTVTPLVINGGETEAVWTDILSADINGFKISTSVSSGNYLKLSNNNGNGVLPYKVANGYTEQNSTSSTAITQGNISCDIYYNATTSSDIYAQSEAIGIDTTSKTYDATAKEVGSFTTPSNYTLATFYFDRDSSGNPTGTPTTSRTDAGTYVVISDVKFTVDGTTYVVGRKQADWTIDKRKLSVEGLTDNKLAVNYGVNVESKIVWENVVSGHSVVPDTSAYNFYESNSGSNSYTISSIVVKSGNDDVSSNYEITSFTIVVSAGDFYVQNSGIDANNIADNKWGSVNNPYIISTPQQLQKLTSIVRNDGALNSIQTGAYVYVTATDKTYSGAYFKLADNLSVGNITPIGTNSAAFSGIFDGNGKTVTVAINVAGNYVGLFGYTSGATIKNLTVNGSVKGSKYVGGVVGYALNTTIDNVTNNASVTARYSTDNDLPTSILQYDGGNATNEGFDKVFDNNISTKFCGNENSSMSFVANLNSNVAVSGFAITNANDTATQTNRRPKTIQIWGSDTRTSRSNYNNKSSGGNTPSGAGESGWTLVYSVTTDNFPTTNYQRNEFAFANNKTYNYQYYWVYIISAGGLIQFAEFDFLAAGEDAGGIVGHAYTDTAKAITNVKNTGNVVGGTYTGGIAGYAQGLSNASLNLSGATSGATNSGNITGHNYVGGVAGHAQDLAISGCTNTGTVSGVDTVGGIAAYSFGGNIVSSENTGTISGTTKVGGITGRKNWGSIGTSGSVTVINKGAVVGTGSYVGGVAGVVDSTTSSIKYVGNEGSVTGANYVGGVAGSSAKAISNSYNTGTVRGTTAVDDALGKGLFVGGIVGVTSSGVTVSHCYNKGYITGTSTSGSAVSYANFVGGIVGYAQGSIEYCANIYDSSINSDSSARIEGNDKIGGIAGQSSSTIDFCYDVQGQRSLKHGGVVGAVVGEGGTVTNSWAIKERNSTGNTPSTINTPNHTLTTDFTVAPRVGTISNSVWTDGSGDWVWEDILTQNINGFKVSGSVATDNYFLSSKGSGNTTEYLAPSKVENSNTANATSRTDTTAFTITAWYGANTQSNIYCATEGIAISNATEIYNGSEQGFDKDDVNPPLASGKVYGVVFDYYNASVTPIEGFICAFDADGNKISGANPSQAGEYNTTVFIKIGDVVVGKKVGVTYKIDQETINVSWTWTDGLWQDKFNRTQNSVYTSTTNNVFIYNRAGQGLSGVTFAYANNTFTDTALSRFTLTGNGTFTTENGTLTEINASGSAYSRTYTLGDTRNFKIHSTNTNVDLSGTSITFEWIIRKNKLYITNLWTSADVGSEENIYVFEYNAAHQGIAEREGENEGIILVVEPDTKNITHTIDGSAYTIAPYVGTINVGTYTRTRTFTINNTTNYEIGNCSSRIVNTTTLLKTQKGVSKTSTSVTYSWKIVQYNIANNFANGKVWFGGIAGNDGLIVGNQSASTISGTTRGGDSVSVDYYPLQSAQNGVQQVLVYGQTRYAQDKFVIYVEYNDGRIAQLSNATATEYTLSDLDTPTAANPTPINTSVKASGLGNFAGDLSKYYTVLYSDFGWKSGKNPSSANWGTADNPYVIDRPEYLLRLSQIVNGGMAWNSIANTAYCYAPQATATAQNRTYSGTFFLVSANIDMTDYVSTDGLTNFLPIGDGEHPFSATFDGSNNVGSERIIYSITYIYNINLFVNNANSSGGERLDYVGLFGYIDGATIQNLTVKSKSVTVNNASYKGVYGRDYVGGVVGKAVNSTIEEVQLDYGGYVQGNDYVGGIVGFAQNTTIANSAKIFNANVKGRFYVGGIAGEWQVNDKNQLGLGRHDTLTPIDSSYVEGVKYVGGLVGWLDLSNCSGSVSFTPQYNNTANKTLEVKGTEYVGALFGTLIGNGYRQSANSTGLTSIVIESGKVGNVTLKPVTYADGNSTYLPKIVGGLVGFIESAALVFGTSWNTNNITFDFNKTSTSFLGGVVGVMGKNSTIEMFVLNKDDGSTLTSVDGAITANTQFGSYGVYNAGSFVGGIVGYVSSQAGTFWNDGTTIFGNAVKLENTANISATGFAGGIFGALGNIALSKIEQSVGAVYNEISVAQNQDNRTNILQKILVGGVREGLSGSTLGIAPTTDSDYVSGANGKLRNTASVYVSKKDNVGGEYVGGILGYCGANVRLVLRNAPQTGDIDTSALNVYSGGTNVSFMGSYAGGVAGFCDNLEHELQYIVVQAKFIDKNATRVGGLIGEMTSGAINGCVAVSAMAAGESISFDTDNFQGTEYVGGLVGKTENATIKDSIATGFNLQSTSITKGGVLGGGTNPTIEASWTFYIANEGATYSTISANEYGKYILVDKDTITSNGSSYPSFEKLCAFAGIANTLQNGVVGVLEFALNVPTQRQLAFYDASGSDSETTNGGSASDFESNNTNGVLTIKLDMETGTSMQVCIIKVEFVNVPKHYANDDARITVVENCYKKPSASSRYFVEVLEETIFDVGDTNQIKRIKARVYFDWNNDGKATLIGESDTASEKTGDYDQEFNPGDEASPYTISTQAEWNDFAYSIYSGANDYDGKFVKLLTDDIVIDNSTHYGTASSTQPLNFNTTCTPNNNSDDSKNAASNLGYNFAGNITQGGSTVEKIYFGEGNTTLSSVTPSFKGTFDGNGHTIIINYTSGGTHRLSVFPNAANATFKNLTIDGTITAGTNTSDSGYDIAAFVGKPFGAITFENCTAAVDIQGLRIIAGFAGYSTKSAPLTFTGCVNKGNIHSFEWSSWEKSGTQDIGNQYDYSYGTGGFIAYASTDIVFESCLNTGNITGGSKIGGLVGRVTNEDKGKTILTINNCANKGRIYSEEYNPYNENDTKQKSANVWSKAGGLVGEVDYYTEMTMCASYNTGEVRAIGNIAGGLVGIIGTIPGGSSNNKAGYTETQYQSKINYCYNTGAVTVGNVAWGGIPSWGSSGYNFNGTNAGGIVGVTGYVSIAYTYNAGHITGYGGVGYFLSWQTRNGGIIGELTTHSNSNVGSVANKHRADITNCYNVGMIELKESKSSEVRYSADIIGYMGDGTVSNLYTITNSYGIANNIINYTDGKGNPTYYSGVNSAGSIDSTSYAKGITLNSLADLTAVMRADGTVKPKAYSGTSEQNLWTASIATIGAQETAAYKNGTLAGYVYVYGCLPQLAVFSVDTYNGLSMNSTNYGKDATYGEEGSYVKQAAGEKLSPYVIRDGIDLMGVQTLVGLGYSFDGKYIEFANGKNNITLDQNLSSDVAQSIDLPTSNSTTAKLDATNGTAYKAKGTSGGYTQTGKSYHLFAKSAVCADDNGTTANTAYGYWLGHNHYYNGAYGNRDGGYVATCTFKIQNLLTIGRNGKTFEGSISGKQDNGTNTTINNLRVSTGMATGGAYAGLFGHAHDAYIGYIEITGDSNIWAYSSDGSQIAATGAIAGYATGNTTIEHCAVSGTTAIGAYGKTDTTNLATDNITFAGGIVGLVDTKQGSAYSAGTTLTIKDCSVNIATTTGDRSTFAGKIVATKNNIGGVLGYVDGASGASGKGNSVRIENCNVQQATIQAASSATTSSHIGGIVGFGSQYVSAFVTGCKVGVDGNVTISGEHSLGGIAGGMSNAQGGYIDSCTVGANASITRIDQGGDGNVAESADHGTAIGGLVGFTQNSTDTVSPLTTTFSGTSSFGGTITVGVAATNQSADSDAAISQIGGIVGDMGSGANFASGSVVTVGGTISVTPNAANVGGVAGRTNTATFIGKFDVHPNMSTANTENVGGFIGKNIGTVYILSDNTDKLADGKLNGTQISIGGTIVGTSEVGGFIGVNNSQSVLHIGSNVANAKPYKSGTLNITITATVTGSGENVGGIVGKNEGASANGATDYATMDIVKGVITQNGAISGKNYVGGIIGLNQGLLTTGGGEADTSVGGATLTTEQINSIKNLSITNKGNVKGGETNDGTYVNGDYVGGVVGFLDSPDKLKATDEGKGAIAGTFTNVGTVEGGRFVGGSIGFVGKNVTITAKDTDTLFDNDGAVTAHGYFAGGSIGALVGTIEGTTQYSVNFENEGNVNAAGFVGGSIGVLAGHVKYAQFVNKSNGLTVSAVNSVGGSVGYIGIPTPLDTVLATLGITLDDEHIKVVNTHFEAAGNLTASATSDVITAAKNAASDASTGWGGVGGAIGVIGSKVAEWGLSNTYYANGNVVASGINNVGGIVGLVLAKDIVISNMLAHKTTVKGGDNVGGIVGATKGTGTVIKSAYAVEGTFEGSGNVGGIIGLAASDTDAKTSYWVKGYSNAILAGTDVKNLQEELGKYEAIVETVDGQEVVFTEEFCKLYTPKTYYADYTGTHKYGNATVTAVTDESVTWAQYFENSLNITGATINNGAWVKPTGATTYTTGTAKTGWYFVYANDKIANPSATTIGTISAEHSPNANLSYWKRIADAYTASERKAGADKSTLTASLIVSGDGQPQKSTLYATATSAGENSGYYLYMATSGNSRPSATYSDGLFFIKTLTANEDALAENVAVYYRTISRGKSLTYNGYARFAPVGITASEGVSVPFIATPTTDTTKADSYCYSSDTSADGTKTEPGTFKSNVKIYYFDSEGTPHVVGGVAIDWEIKKRDLEAELSVPSGKLTYGDPDINAVLTIANVAPIDGNNQGASGNTQFEISVKDENGNEIAKFTWNGTGFNGQSADGKVVVNNVTVSNGGFGNGDDLSGDDLQFNVDNIDGLDLTTRTFSCNINFLDAKTYKVSVSTPNKESKYNPSPILKDQTITVNPAELTLTRTTSASHYFDNSSTGKGAQWTVSGFKFSDGALQFAAFEPVFVMELGKQNTTKEITETAMHANGELINTITINNVIQVAYGGATEGQGGRTLSFNLTGVSKVGDYYIQTKGGKGYRVGNYTLTFDGASVPTYSITENKITITESTNESDGTHIYNGSQKGTITLTFTTDAGKSIENLGTFVEQFFKVATNGVTEKTKPSASSSNTTVTWVFETGINAKKYSVTLNKGDGYDEASKNCSHTQSVPKTYYYEITKRQLTVEFTQTGSSPYVYNTYHQGLSTVKISNLCQVGNVWDSVNITLNVGNNSISVSSNGNNAVDVKDRVNTRNVGTYTATINSTLGGTSSGNYYISNTGVSTSWTINQYTLRLSGLTGGEKTYDGTAVTPKLIVDGSEVSDGKIRFGADTITIKYSATVGGVLHDGDIVNAGTYTISIGGNATDAIVAMRDGENTTQNYTVAGTDEATYTIAPRQIKLSWDSATAFVFNNAEQGLKITGVESVSEGGNGQLAVSSSTLTEARIKGYAGKDVIVITVSGAITHVADGKKSMTASISSVTGKNADNSTDSIKGNYAISVGSTSGEFEITPSVVSISFNAPNATLEKVYDGNATVPTSQILGSYFTVSATGHVPSNPFTISGRYDDKNVVYDSNNNVTGGKAVTFSYTFTDPTGVGDYIEGSVDTAAYNVGKITPAHIKVTLDKLRSNKATRTYTDGTTYGGNGVSGNGTSSTYRAGEGFRVSGVLSGDSVTINANYAEALDSRNSSANSGFDFAKYVNDVYKDSDGTFKKATSGTYLKKLVFEMTGTSAGNYTFNVYHSSDGAYGNSDGNHVTKVTVYDSRETDQSRKNASGSPSIQIEITVKSVKVEYSNTAQSYANDDNTYNTDWKRVTGTNKETDKAGADIIVTNGWMYSDGIDRDADSTDQKREYHGYTTIQGRSGNSRLGASVTTKDGMNLNYRLSNQPTLTIAYFVAEGDEYKISSLAQLLIASFYYTAHQNPQNLDMIKIVSSGYEWVTVVKVDESGAYIGDYEKPSNSPITNSNANTWDEYLAELQAADYAVFLDTEKKEWGYYQSTQSTTTAIPTKFVQIKDITGTFTTDDIEILNAFFTTSSVGEDGTVTTTTYNWNGSSKQFLTNVLKARAGANVTINGSLFESTAKADGSNELTGFDGSYDGNGYVIEYLNIMGYGKTNVGLFDIIGASGIVKNVHLRNVTINASGGNVGGIAGSVLAAAEAASETSIKNVSAHGAINVSGGTVGGLFGTSARDIENAIVLGTIISQNATVGGVVGTTSASVKNVVSLVQITANGGTVNPITTSSATIENSYHMTNAVWQKGSIFVNVSGNSKTFNELMSGSVSGYGNENKYYYAGESAPTKGTFDVLDDVQLTALSAIGAQNAANERQSMRLKDIVSVYLMMYSLSKMTGTLTSESNTFNVNVYALGSSWLVGNADGTQSNPIAIANKQNVSLLRQLPFATFTLKKNIAIDITSTFAGAFFGTVESATDSTGTSLGYKITCNKDMFEAYAPSSSSWLTT